MSSTSEGVLAIKKYGGEESACPGFIHFAREPLDNKHLLGYLHRSSVTGEVLVRRPRDFPDFFLVDLYRRPGLPAKLASLQSDTFLFWAVPMLYRTWLYHQLFKTVVVGGEDAMIRYCLAERCIDAPIRAGRWSPLVVLGPGLLLAGLTGDMGVVAAAIALAIVLYFIARWTNSMRHYRFARLYSLPFRIGFVALVVARYQAADALNAIVTVLLVIVSAVDLVSGDLAQLTNLRFHCDYTVLKSLPNRVFVCQRSGVLELQEKYGHYRQIPDSITGIAPWLKHHLLIAEIGGLLVELVPMSASEWSAAYQVYTSGLEDLPYVALDALGEEALGEEEYEAKDHSAKVADDLKLEDI